MAQVVGYFENDVTFREGPFVIVNVDGWRIEVELKGHLCPALPDSSIYQIMEKMGRPPGKTGKAEAERTCDRLNEMVREGEIVLHDGAWVARRKERVSNDRSARPAR